jgi:hypothetical protein
MSERASQFKSRREPLCEACVPVREELDAHWQTIKLPFDAGDYRLDPLSATDAYGFKVTPMSNMIIVTRDGGRTWRAIHATLNPA